VAAGVAGDPAAVVEVALVGVVAACDTNARQRRAAEMSLAVWQKI